MSEPEKRKKRFWQKRRIWVPTVLLLFVIFARNLIVHELIERIGSSVLGNEISVGEVNLGLTTFEIQDIRINEPESHDLPQLAVKHIDVTAASFGNICNGVYLSDLNIESPELHLRFDEEGNLLSKFPEAGASEESTEQMSIPLQAFSLTDARLVVHQTGKPPMTIVLNELTATVADRIHVKGLLSDLLGGTIKIDSSLDAETFAGKTKLTIDGVNLDTNSLAELPLVPPVVAQEHVSATAGLSLNVVHPPNETDLRLHSLKFGAWLEKIKCESIRELPDEIIVSADNRDGKIRVAVKTNPLAGTFLVGATTDLNQTPLTVDARAQIADVEVHRLAETLAKKLGSAIPPFALTTGLNVSARLTMRDEEIAFQCKATARASDMSVENIPVKKLTTIVEAKGAYSLASRAENNSEQDSQIPLSGFVAGKIDWDGVSLDEIAKSQLAKQIEQLDATGEVNGGVRFKIPLDRIADPNSYVVNGELNTNQVSSRGLTLADTSVQATLTAGKLNVTLPSTEVYDSMTRQLATISGSVESGVTLDSTMIANVAANELNTKSIVRLLGQSDEKFDGVISASATAAVPLNSLADPSKWSADAKLQCAGMVLQEERLSDFTGLCHLRNGRIQIPEVAIQWRNTACRFDLNGTIDKDRTIQGSFSATPILLTDISQAARQFSNTELPIRGSADVAGNFRVSAFPVKFLATGNSHLSDAMYAKTRIGDADLNWRADESGFRLNYSSDDMLGGTCSVTADMRALDWTKTVLTGKFDDVPAERLMAIAEVQLPTSGVFEGGFQCDSIASIDSLKGNAWLRSQNVAVRGVNFEIAEGNLVLNEGQATITSRGQVASGSYNMTAGCILEELIAFSQTDAPKLHDVPVTGEFKLERTPVARLIAAADLDSELAPLDATISLHCVRDENAAKAGLIGSAMVTTENISWNHSRLSEYLTAELVLSPDRATLRQVRGRFADGQVSGNAEIAIKGVPRGTFRFSATNVNLRRASTPFLGSDVASGSGSLYVTGRIDNTISGQLKANVDNANLAGIAVRRARVPVDWSYSQSSGVARWNCRAGTAEAGAGRIHLDSEGSFNRVLTMNNSVRLEHVDTSKLMRGSSVGVGIIDGTCTLQARRTNAPEKMTGTFDLQLTDADAMEMPILNQLPNMMKLPSVSSIWDKDDGNYLYGRLGGGLIHLEELAISQSNVHVLMNGTSTLDGKLNLNITASTEANGPMDELLSLADSPLMAAGAAPIAMMARANEALKNRVVHVEVNGTASRPMMRLQPGKQLTQDAVKFFLQSTVGSRVADAATNQQKGRRRR